MKTLADDFTRVLRQNDTLRGENETLKEMLAGRDRLEVTGATDFTVEHGSVVARMIASANADLATAQRRRYCVHAWTYNELLDAECCPLCGAQRTKMPATFFDKDEPMDPRPLRAASAFMSEPLKPDHVYVGPRCGRCSQLKEAIEASNLACVA